MRIQGERPGGGGRGETGLREVLDAVPANLWSTRPDGSVDFINQHWQEFTGLPRGDAMGWGWEAAVHPDDLARFVSEWREALRSARAMDSEVRVRRADGEYRWLFVRNVPVRDEAGAILKWYGIGVDVDERKTVQLALRRSEARLDDAQRLAHVGYWDVDLEAGRITLSEECWRIVGLPPRETIDLSEWLDRWALLIHPQDRPRIDDAAAAALGGGPRYDLEYRLVRPDGDVRVVRSRADVTRDESGRPRRMFGVIHDITELRQAESERRTSEARFRTLVDFAADAFMLHTADGTVIDVNHEACQSLGYTRDELIGMKPPQFDAALDLPALLEVTRRIEAGEVVTFETRHRRKDGTTFPVEVRGRQVPDGDRMGISFSRDITLRKRAEEERERLHRLEADLARINRVTTMGELTASLAHEINQPIAAAVTDAKTCLRWLTRAQPDLQEARDAAARTVKDATRAADIVSRVRQVFRRSPTAHERLDVSDLVREIVALVNIEASLHGVTIRTELDGRLPPVLGDRVQLQQLVLNLILNGIESTREVPGPREVTVVTRADAGDHVLVSVADTGAGLPDVDPAHLFDAFFTTKPDGTGMGLTISRSIVEAHSGQICAAANEAGGATFLVELPVVSSASA
jgi:PAS domain S-box-containing protein